MAKTQFLCSNIQKGRDIYLNKIRVSSEKGKSFDDNFAFFLIFPLFLHFVRSRKNAKYYGVKCESIAKKCEKEIINYDQIKSNQV